MNTNNVLRPTARQLETAVAAGGRTMFELRMAFPFASRLDLEVMFYMDPATELWIRRGVVLFTPRDREIAAI